MDLKLISGSNVSEALAGVPMDSREYNMPLDIDANDVIRTLGIEWNPTLDEFLFTALIMSHVATDNAVSYKQIV